MSSTKHLLIRNKNPHDEFYTLYKTVKKLVGSVNIKLFANKTIYCPCDSLQSNFTQYFITNFQNLNLKKLICTHYTENNYQIFIKTKKQISIKKCQAPFINILATIKPLITLKANGSFLSQEFTKYWQEADYIITNPPFSKIEEFMRIIEYFNKYFLIIAPSLVSNKSYFRKYIQEIYSLSNSAKFITPHNQLINQSTQIINNFYNYHKYKTFELITDHYIYKVPINRFWSLDPTFYKIIKFTKRIPHTFERMLIQKKQFLVPIQEKKKDILNLATVFSGIGAIEQAFKKLNINHQIIFACDNDKFVKDSYFANYKCHKWYDDIKQIETIKYKNKIDLFVGGSPCQSFSFAGKRKGFNDTRGILLYEFIKLVYNLQPKMFIFENVKGLIYHDEGKTWKIVKKEFEKLNYVLYYKVLNAKDYGIPQNRERLFLIGYKELNIKYNFPQPQPLKTTMFNYLESKVNHKYYCSPKITPYLLKRLQEGWAQINQPILKCLTTSSRNNFVKEKGQIRNLTPREYLRCMGFNDNFKIVVSDNQIYKQAGNSIVVNVLEAILKNCSFIKDYIKKV